MRGYDFGVTLGSRYRRRMLLSLFARILGDLLALHKTRMMSWKSERYRLVLRHSVSGNYVTPNDSFRRYIR